jgi:hypothetical protein
VRAPAALRFTDGYAQGVAGWERKSAPEPLEVKEKSGMYDEVFARGYWCGYHDRRQGRSLDPAPAWQACTHLHAK